MVIQKLTAQNLCDVNKAANQPFPLIGRIKPSFQNGVWSYEEELQEPCRWKSYPADEMDYSVYFQREEKAGFLDYSPTECIGQILLRKDWNRYAFIEDICVCQTARGQGVGTALIRRAAQWAAEAGLCGLALETQDNNLLACRFYAKCGFQIGAVNTMLYRNFEAPWRDETAIFWYLPFEKEGSPILDTASLERKRKKEAEHQ